MYDPLALDAQRITQERLRRRAEQDSRTGRGEAGARKRRTAPAVASVTQAHAVRTRWLRRPMPATDAHAAC